MTKAEIQDVWPLTPLQEGMLFHSLYDPQGRDPYVEQMSFTIEGPFDAAAMRAAFGVLLARHATLRAGFGRRGDGQPFQAIARTVATPWQEVDLTHLPEDEQLPHVDDVLAQDRAARFDPAQPPLLRVTVARLTDTRVCLVLTIHHVLVDGWSVPVLLDELFTLYARRGDDSDLPAPGSYRGYLSWLVRQDRAAAESAWRAALDGVGEPTRLAPPGAGLAGEPLDHVVELPPAVTVALRELARRCDVTVNTVVQAAWGLLLSRLTGRDDVVFGATVAGRPPEVASVETIVGLLVNTVPVRVRPAEDDSFDRFLRRLQDEQAVLMPHHHLGLADIQRLTGVDDMFDTIISFQNFTVDLEPSGVGPDGLRIAINTAKDVNHFPLTLNVSLATERLLLRLGYDPTAFDPGQVGDISGRLARILSTVASRPDIRVGAIDVLSAAEREQVLVEWNTTPEITPATLVDRFEAQAAHTPDSVAAVFEGKTLTYAELDARCDGLAHGLADRGIGPDRRVAVVLPRSLDLLVAVYAVLKAGAAYVPIDPGVPAARLKAILQDARPDLVLDQLTTSPTFGSGRTGVLPVPTDPACVLYPAGSGKPKGIVLSHGAVVDRIDALQRVCPLDGRDRVALKTPVGFGPSIAELFWPLQTGASVVVAGPDEHRDPGYLVEFLRAYGVTTVHLVPSMLGALCAEATAATALRRIICTGEGLDETLLRSVQVRFPNADLVSLFGPTEAVVHAGHTRTYVLDAGLRPVPPGTPGEVYVAGPGLADGYLGRPGATAERWVADPFGPGRMFRTGERAKYSTDGLIAPETQTRELRSDEPAPATAVRDHARTPHEEIVSRVFAELLGLPDIRVDDDFFALGGNSLLAVRAVARISALTEVELTIRSFFETRTPAALAEVVVGTVRTSRPKLTSRSRPPRPPLSYAQQRLWFLNRLEGPSATYNIAVALRMSATCDADVLRDALGDVVDRHETLRTVYPEHDGQPYQRVLENGRPDFAVRVTADPARDLAEAAAVGFDLTSDPPMRARRFDGEGGERLLLLVFHHIASDGWSWAVFARDLATAYEARTAGRPPAWQPLPVHYADFALWQRDLLGSESDPASLTNRQLDFWQRTLSGVPEQLELPTDRPRPAEASYAGDTVALAFDADLHRRLLDLANASGTTTFMVVHAALSALYTRLGAGTDIPIGTPVAGRVDEAVEDLVGVFINTLVLRTDTGGDPSFRRLLDRVRSVDLAAYQHQDLPFERLVEKLNPTRSMSRHPLFQTLLTFHGYRKAEPLTESVGLEVVAVESRIAKFDLSFDFLERYDQDGQPDGVAGTIEYATDLFDRATVQGIAERLARLLHAVADDPDRSIGSVDVLAPDEADRLAAWNRTGGTVTDGLLPVLFQEQAARAASRTAVVDESSALSFEQLNARANRLAHLLIRAGVGPEELVALALPRGTDMIIALWAVLKAGAAYLPVDLTYPAKRIALILDDAAPALLLTTTEHRSTFRNSVVPSLCVDALPDDGRDHDPTDADRVRPLDPAHPAYVLYTSGSTGRPKGVVVSHAALRNFFHGLRGELPAAAPDGRPYRIALMASLSFDTSWEPLHLLVRGAELHVLSDDTRLDVDALVSYVVRRRIDGIDVSPSHCAQLLDRGLLADPEHRPAMLMVGGEASPAALWHRLREAQGTEAYNLYGPTECTVDSVTCAFEDSEQPVIGRPLLNTTAYVLDDRLHPVPVGVRGELYLGGANLARGYLHRRGLTSQRFVANPFGPPGARMYRSGDLARWRPDGTLDYLGRADDQVKLRAFRIELGEISAEITQRSEISLAAVIVREDRPGDRRIVAYVVAAPGQRIDVAAIRRDLAATLPDYMVPSAFVELSGLPLTANAKLDRAALPPPPTAERPVGSARSPREEVLRTLYAEVLGLAEVRTDDNFFELGGHSLLATQLVSRVRDAIAGDMSIRDLFAAPTPAALAERLDSGEAAGDPLAPLLPIATGDGRPPLFCVHPASGLCLAYSRLIPYLGPRQPIYGLQLPELAGSAPRSGAAGPPLPPTLDDLVDNYIAELRRVPGDGRYRLLGWSAGGNIAHAIAVRLQELGEHVELLALIDAHPVEIQPAVDDQVVRAEVRQKVADTELLRDRVEMATQAILHSFALVDRHAAGVFKGDVLFFAAARSAFTVRAVTDAWRPYVDGFLDVHKVPSDHDGMLSAGPVRRIGEVVAAALSRPPRNGT